MDTYLFEGGGPQDGYVAEIKGDEYVQFRTPGEDVNHVYRRVDDKYTYQGTRLPCDVK